MMTTFRRSIILFCCSVSLTACSPADNESAPEQPIREASHPQICELYQGMTEYTAGDSGTNELRYLNQRWRTLNSDNRFRNDQDAQASRDQLTLMNYELAEESIALLEQSIAIAEATHAKVDRLRQVSQSDSGIPASISRELNSELADCCRGPLEGNSTALVREEKHSLLYRIGTKAYFVQRDLTALIANERSFSTYKAELAKLKRELANSEPPVLQRIVWANCPN